MTGYLLGTYIHSTTSTDNTYQGYLQPWHHGTFRKEIVQQNIVVLQPNLEIKHDIVLSSM